jgi:hypothetical protein
VASDLAEGMDQEDTLIINTGSLQHLQLQTRHRACGKQMFMPTMATSHANLLSKQPADDHLQHWM